MCKTTLKNKQKEILLFSQFNECALYIMKEPPAPRLK